MIKAVIGKNFGDEGKGLAVDYFCGRVPKCLVVKHNGGAQAGHTVLNDGKRFVFHQLSSGSFKGADTFFASTYYPDFYKLREEIEDFGKCPKIFVSKNTSLIYPDDVLINMALEESRGDKRHGSCGMGINEGYLRSHAGFSLTAGEAAGLSSEKLAKRMKEIRDEYVSKRLKETGLDNSDSEYTELLSSENVLINAADEMLKGLEYTTLVEDESEFLRSREDIVFESGQGLLLDSENERFAPHVTASRTGLFNVAKILKEAELKLTEAVFVTRTYVTRHGAGDLPFESPKESIGSIATDLTNVENKWQGNIRYAKHESVSEFLNPVKEDIKLAESIYPGLFENPESKAGIFVTHLNETDSKIVFSDKKIEVESFFLLPEVKECIDNHYLSYEG